MGALCSQEPSPPVDPCRPLLHPQTTHMVEKDSRDCAAHRVVRIWGPNVARGPRPSCWEEVCVDSGEGGGDRAGQGPEWGGGFCFLTVSPEQVASVCVREGGPAAHPCCCAISMTSAAPQKWTGALPAIGLGNPDSSCQLLPSGPSRDLRLAVAGVCGGWCWVEVTNSGTTPPQNFYSHSALPHPCQAVEDLGLTVPPPTNISGGTDC